MESRGLGRESNSWEERRERREGGDRDDKRGKGMAELASWSLQSSFCELVPLLMGAVAYRPPVGDLWHSHLSCHTSGFTHTLSLLQQ